MKRLRTTNVRKPRLSRNTRQHTPEEEEAEELELGNNLLEDVLAALVPLAEKANLDEVAEEELDEAADVAPAEELAVPPVLKANAGFVLDVAVDDAAELPLAGGLNANEGLLPAVAVVVAVAAALVDAAPPNALNANAGFVAVLDAAVAEVAGMENAGLPACANAKAGFVPAAVAGAVAPLWPALRAQKLKTNTRENKRTHGVHLLTWRFELKVGLGRCGASYRRQRHHQRRQQRDRGEHLLVEVDPEAAAGILNWNAGLFPVPTAVGACQEQCFAFWGCEPPNDLPRI